MLKTLITVSEIKQFIDGGKKTIYVDANTIITPAAMDVANESGIKIVAGASPEKIFENHPMKQGSGATVDPALIAEIIGEVMKSLGQSSKSSQLVKEADPSGMKLVKGNSVVLENFDTGDPSHNVKFKEILNSKELSISFMSMEDKTTFDWVPTANEIKYIIEGTLECTINGKKYTGTAGDVLFIPVGAKGTFSTPDKTKFLFITYPVSWAKLS